MSNPLPGTGGADPESREDARRSIPVSLQALGRVVSVQDFADFARTFAGISKASAVALSDGRRRFVHLTIGGEGDIPIDTSSDLYQSLVQALANFGDASEPFQVEAYERIVVAGAARVRVRPEYEWSTVGPAVRAALLSALGYDRRELGQPVYPSEVVAAIQGVPGVDYVDLDALGGIRSNEVLTGQIPPIQAVNPIVPLLAHREADRVIPAQLALLPPDLADLFVLTEVANG